MTKPKATPSKYQTLNVKPDTYKEVKKIIYNKQAKTGTRVTEDQVIKSLLRKDKK